MNIEALAREAGFEKSYYGPNFTPGIYAYNMEIVERFANLIREAVVQELVAGSGEPVATLTVRDDMGADIKFHQALTLLPGQTFALYTRPAPEAKQEPHGWVTMWPEPGGKHKPVFKLGKDKPRYGAELDDVLDIYPVFTTTPDSATRSADSAESFCDCTPNHLCKGRMVHLPRGEQCDQCGEEA